MVQQSSEPLLREAMDAVPESIAVIDGQGTILWVNRSWRNFGLQSDPQSSGTCVGGDVGINYLSVCEAGMKQGAEGAEGALEGLRGVLEGRLSDFSAEYSHHIAGQQHWFRMRASPCQASCGGAVIVHADITESRVAARTAQESQALFAHFMDALPAAAYIKDERGATVYVNPFMSKIIGQRPWVLKTTAELFDPLQATQMVSDDLRALECGSAVSEEQVTGADGELRFYETRKFRIDRLGQRPLLGGISMDITEARRLYAVLQASEAKYRALVETTATGYLILDGLGLVIDANAEYVRLSGHHALEEILGRSVIEWTAPHEVARNQAAVAQCARDGFIHNFVIDYRGPNGTVTAIEINATVVGEGASLRIISLCRDITERKRTELELERHRSHLEALVQVRTANLSIAKDAAESANRAKTTFLRNMSHELRTPLNGMIGMTALALSRATDARQIDQLEKAAHASKHLLEIINDVLDISRIEAEQMNLEQVSFNLGEVFDQLRDLTLGAALQKGIELDFELPGSLGQVSLCGDRVHLRQILLNLTSNAVKFTHRGGVRVTVSVVADRPVDILLRFDVVDTGIGIAFEDQQRLFTPFEQVDASMTRKYGGTGLGLAISKKLAELMGGEMGVDSCLGEGSAFWFTARLARQAPFVGAPAASADAMSERLRSLGERSPMRILIVEDEPTNQMVGRAIMESAGVSVDVAVDGVAAVMQAGLGRYDLILMDIQMPLMDGLQATRLIRQQAHNAAVPIIAMTANAFVEDRQKCIEAGMNDFIAKPFEARNLCGAVLKWLGANREAATSAPQRPPERPDFES